VRGVTPSEFETALRLQGHPAREASRAVRAFREGESVDVVFAALHPEIARALRTLRWLEQVIVDHRRALPAESGGGQAA
jgi:hypothetical protein